MQNTYLHDTEYNWSSENIADTLVMRMGDKRSWVTLPGSELETDAEGTITGDIGVLPTLTMSTPISVLINMAVNGVPTQYMTLVNETHLLHARSYNFDWTVNVEDGQLDGKCRRRANQCGHLAKPVVDYRYRRNLKKHKAYEYER